ncbi:MAG: hypothetical protein PF690_05595 [Deltaproteobacteria bacterium]|nr:hypothetical protein [Deltaproteobacteria bacterium]
MIDRVISIIDTHAAGEPTRIIVGGLPRISSQAYITGINQLISHRKDPMKFGFQLG